MTQSDAGCSLFITVIDWRRLTMRGDTCGAFDKRLCLFKTSSAWRSARTLLVQRAMFVLLIRILVLRSVA